MPAARLDASYTQARIRTAACIMSREPRAESREPRAESRELRRAIERAVQAMIDLLDLMDGDPELELDEDDEEHDGREPIDSDLLGGSL